MTAHGTNAGYQVGGCRCAACTTAHRDYARAYWRDRHRPDGGGRRTVPAAPVRTHLRSLSSQGVGYKTVARLVGCSASNLAKLLGMWDASSSSWSNGPTRRVTRDLADRILAVDVTDAAGAQKVPAEPTWRLLNRLLGAGWTKAELARRIHGPQSAGLQVGRTRVRASTAAKVRAVYDELAGRRPSPKRSRWMPTPSGSAVSMSCAGCGIPVVEHPLDRFCGVRR